MKTLVKKLAVIQVALNAPKSQYNNFGKYHYRNCEDILQAVKPLLNGLVLTIADDVVDIGGRVYFKSTASITDGENTISATAFAREADGRKGMDLSQVSGSTSSYSKKYALNGLLLIDDNKDADSGNPKDVVYTPQSAINNLPTIDASLKACKTVNQLTELYKTLSDTDKQKYQDQFTSKKGELNAG